MQKYDIYDAIVECIDRTVFLAKIIKVEKEAVCKAVISFENTLIKINNGENAPLEKIIEDMKVIVEEAYDQGLGNEDQFFLAELAVDNLESFLILT